MKERQRTLPLNGLILVFSLALGVAAAGLTAKEFRRYERALEAERAVSALVVPTTDIYVAARPLRYGERLTIKDIRAVRWPIDAVPEGSFTTETKELFPAQSPDFRSVLRAMEAGEPILKVKVTEPGAEAGVSARLAPGMRAFAIQVDVQTGVPGLLRPGDRVDVYWTGQNSAQSGTITRLINAGLQVVAVDQSADADSTKVAVARTITVQTTPQQIASLTQAQATGRLSLSLVGGDDSSVAIADDIDQSAIVGVAEIKAVEPAPPRSCTITTRRAGEKAVETPVICRN